MFWSVRNDEFVGKARWIKCDGEDEKKNCDYWCLPLYSVILPRWTVPLQ